MRHSVLRGGPVPALTLTGVFLLSLAGCLTPADRWLSENLSVRQKADIIADRGVEQYNQMVDLDALARIPAVRNLFTTALSVDPLNARATEYLAKVDAFLTKRQTETVTKVKSLQTRPTLSAKDKYQLVVLVQQLQVLAPPDFDLTKLSAQTAPLRVEVLKKSSQDIAEAEKALTAAKTEAALGKALSAVRNAIDALRVIDPKSADADAASVRLAAFLDARNKADLDLARKSLSAKDYAAATKALDRVEQARSGAGAAAGDELSGLQYDVALAWARDLFAAKKYPEAGARINDALQVRVTPEAKDLRDKITAAANLRDYDAEYDALDKQLDSLIGAGDLRTSWNLITQTGPKLKKPETKNRLAARQKQVLDAAHALYDAAVQSYNDEDYREAKTWFDTVALIDPAYQLVKAYQDKAKAKLQALGGN